MSFVNASSNFKNYVIQNLLVLKMLYDRGYPVTEYHDVMLIDVFNFFFGKGVTMEDAPDKMIPEILQNPEEDSDEEYHLHWFKERPQLIITLPLPYQCDSEEEKELLEALHKVVLDGEALLYMDDMFFMEAIIKEGKTMAIRAVDYHPDTNLDDYSVDILFVFENVINFFDKVKEIGERRKLNEFTQCHVA